MSGLMIKILKPKEQQEDYTGYMTEGDISNIPDPTEVFKKFLKENTEYETDSLQAAQYILNKKKDLYSNYISKKNQARDKEAFVKEETMKTIINAPGVRVFVFNVGQGSFGAVYHTESGKLIIIDVGKPYDKTHIRLFDSTMEVDQIFRSFELLFSNFKKISSIDIIISHHDYDHYSMLYTLLDNILKKNLFKDKTKIRLILPAVYVLKEYMLKDNNKTKNIIPVEDSFYKMQEPSIYNSKDDYKEIIKFIRKESYDKDDIKKKALFDFLFQPWDKNQSNAKKTLEIYNQITVELINPSEETNKEKKIISTTGEVNLEITAYQIQNNPNTNYDSNSLSLLIKVSIEKGQTDKIKVLFPGDATDRAFENINSQNKDALKAGILIGSHHGGKHENKENIYRIVDPDMVIFSAPISSTYGHVTTEAYEVAFNHLADKKKAAAHIEHNLFTPKDLLNKRPFLEDFLSNSVDNNPHKNQRIDIIKSKKRENNSNVIVPTGEADVNKPSIKQVKKFSLSQKRKIGKVTKFEKNNTKKGSYNESYFPDEIYQIKTNLPVFSTASQGTLCLGTRDAKSITIRCFGVPSNELSKKYLDDITTLTFGDFTLNYLTDYSNKG